ncbi:1,4-alpha-glucan branching enzyme [Balamuthia mandrillaris]
MYVDFRKAVLPYIVKQGYNCVQLMGIMEHSYYASFGYQVTNFFAVSSRFGLPEELKALIDEAHGLGVLVFLDVVHSHASSNIHDGLNQFDGEACPYFRTDEIHHPVWQTRLFRYGEWEVLRFLLSNVRWFVEEYHFDGFRFDGVTSMLFRNHGIGQSAPWPYHVYFDEEQTDESCYLYLALANHLLHSLYPSVITIAEDVSGMPTLCLPPNHGGLGFDYRLAMGIPDMWNNLLWRRDEDWDMRFMLSTLSERRKKERRVAYAECHDQCFQGSSTIAFRLMGALMEEGMHIERPLSIEIERGLALHKMIRLVTNGLGGDSYLNFMGNEWAHPGWVDFPRQGNSYSYQHCRRRWDLLHDSRLRYKQMAAFDQAMQSLEESYGWLNDPYFTIQVCDEVSKIIAFERGGLLWLFNWHITDSQVGYRVGVSGNAAAPKKWEVVLDTDDVAYGGHGRVKHSVPFFAQAVPQGQAYRSIQLYLPCRTALVLASMGSA